LHVKNVAYPAAKLGIWVSGIEKTRWAHEAKLEGSDKKKAHGINKFFDLEETLATFDKIRVEPGFYTFPFSFVIPPWVPSSFIYSGKIAPKLSILYTIRVMMEDAQINKAEVLPTILGKRRLLVT
jgi:hypothetical protein